MAFFEITFDLGHELVGCRPIDDPVVKRQAEVAHRPDGDSVIEDNGSLLDCANPEDRNLRLMNDWCTEQAAEPSMICNREGPALNLLGTQLFRPGAFSQVSYFFG
jgi:hypothetical protein